MTVRARPNGAQSDSKIERQVLRLDVLDRIRTEILTGELPAGTRLQELQLAERLGVSRGPIREGIRELEHESLVQVVPHRGAVVVGLAEEEIGPIYEIRAVLESQSFARAARRVSQTDLDELTSMVMAMVQACDHRAYEEVVELDLDFHGRVIELSGFRIVRRMWANILSLVRAHTFRSLDLDELPDDELHHAFRREALSHYDLVDALRTGQPSRASAAARRHVRHALKLVRVPAVAAESDGPPERSTGER